MDNARFLFLLALVLLGLGKPSFSQDKASIREVSETMIGPYTVREQPADTLCVSPDISQITYWDRQGKKSLLFVDGKEMPQYAGGPGFCRYSPDSKHLLFSGSVAGGMVSVLDGKEGKKYTGINKLTFSPDSQRTAYQAWNTKPFVVLDGAESPQYDQIKALTFSPDSKRFAFVAWRDKKRMVVVDGSEISKYDAAFTPVFSPDSKQVAFAARVGVKFMVVVDGKEGKLYDDIQMVILNPEVGLIGRKQIYEKAREFVAEQGEIPGDVKEYIPGPVFSPDGQHIVYIAEEGKRWLLVMDGKEQSPLGDVTRARFSADGKHFGYVSGQSLVIDDKKLGEVIFSSFGFTPGNKPFFWSSQGIMLDGRLVTDPKGKSFSETYYPVFSLDGQRMAFVSIEGDRHVVVDGIKGKGYFRVHGIQFSPDGQHLLYIAASTNGKGRVVLDGVEGIQQYDGSFWNDQTGDFGFDASNKFHYFVLKGKAVYRIDETIK